MNPLGNDSNHLWRVDWPVLTSPAYMSPLCSFGSTW